MDFKKATELFRDPGFDGEPVVTYKPDDDDDPVPPDPKDPDEDDEGEAHEPEGAYKIHVSGVEVNIIAERVEYMGEDGQLITESYRDFSRKQIRSEFSSLDAFLRSWNDAKKKQAIIDELEEHGIILENLAEAVGKEFGDFDLICHIAFDQPPLTRAERASNVKKRNYFTKYGKQARAVLEALLEKYADEGISQIENRKVLKHPAFKKIGTPMEIINGVFGGISNYEEAIQDLEEELYKHA